MVKILYLHHNLPPILTVNELEAPLDSVLGSFSSLSWANEIIILYAVRPTMSLTTASMTADEIQW